MSPRGVFWLVLTACGAPEPEPEPAPPLRPPPALRAPPRFVPLDAEPNLHGPDLDAVLDDFTAGRHFLPAGCRSDKVFVGEVIATRARVLKHGWDGPGVYTTAQFRPLHRFRGPDQPLYEGTVPGGRVEGHPEVLSCGALVFRPGEIHFVKTFTPPDPARREASGGDVVSGAVRLRDGSGVGDPERVQARYEALCALDAGAPRR